MVVFGQNGFTYSGLCGVPHVLPCSYEFPRCSPVSSLHMPMGSPWMWTPHIPWMWTSVWMWVCMVLCDVLVSHPNAYSCRVPTVPGIASRYTTTLTRVKLLLEMNDWLDIYCRNKVYTNRKSCATANILTVSKWPLGKSDTNWNMYCK